MNRKSLYNGFNEVDDDILERSETASKNNKKSRPVWLKWSAVAACLCLVVAVVLPIIQNSNEWHTEKPAKLNLEGAVLQTGDGTLTYHTDDFSNHILAFTIVLNNEIPESCVSFYADNILHKWTDNEGVVHSENELFQVITPCASFETNFSYTVVDNILSITVNGEETTTMPTEPGTYEVVVDYSELYNQFDVVAHSVTVWPFGELVINSEMFAK